MAGVNRMTLLGNLGGDPLLKTFPDGTPVANFSVATSDEWKDKTTGEKKSKTEWHKLVATRHWAEIAGKYLKKGSQAYFEGKLQTRQWEKDGVTHYTTEIHVSEIKLLGGGNSGRNDSQGDGDKGVNQGQGAFPESFDEHEPF